MKRFYAFLVAVLALLVAPAVLAQQPSFGLTKDRTGVLQTGGAATGFKVASGQTIEYQAGSTFQFDTSALFAGDAANFRSQIGLSTFVATVAGTTNQVLVSASSGNVIFSLPSTITGVNSITAQAATDLMLNAGSGTQNINLSPSGTGSVIVSTTLQTPQLSIGGPNTSGFPLEIHKTGTGNSNVIYGTGEGFMAWLMEGAGTGSNGLPTIRFDRAQGTIASETALQNGDSIGVIKAFGYNNSTKNEGASIVFVVRGATSGTTMPTAIEFNTRATTASGLATSITQNGNLLVGSSRSEAGLTGSGGIVAFSATDSSPSAAGSIISYGGIYSTKQITGATGIFSFSPTAGIGYTTGAGGTVTQLTSKSTGVTLNKVSGQITLNGAALAAATTVSFTLTNSTIAATDVIPPPSIASAGTAGAYDVVVDAIAAGSCRISITNRSAGSLSEALILNFVVIKAVNA